MPISVLADFFGFLIRPDLDARDRGFSGRQVVQFVTLLVFKVAVTFAIIGLLTQYKAWAGFDRTPVEEALSDQWWVILLIAVVAAPLLEELAFRSWLTKTFWLSAPAFCIALFLGLYFGIVALFDATGGALAMRQAALIVVPFFAVVAGFVWMWRLRRAGRYEAFVKRLFPFVFYLTVIGFGLSHIGNYETSWTVAWPMTLNPMFSALVYGFARVRWGLGAAILLHVGNNGVAFFADVVLGL